MHGPNLAAIDLNLLVALDALLEERHVTRAARRIGLSQPATSHALARLRELIGDPLLVRSGATLVPTPRAIELAIPLRAILASIQETLAGARFDPATAQRSFSIASSDYGELMLVPALLRRISELAPRIDLVVRPVTDEPIEALASGRVDLLVGVEVPFAAASVQRRKLFDDGFACLVREGHPVLRRGLDLERYVALGHVFIAPRGTRGGVVDDALAKKKLSRRVVAMVPSFTSAPAIVAQTDLVLTMPARLAARLARPFGLRVLEPPLSLPRFTISAFWHERSRQDVAHTWLRGVVAECASTLA